MSLKYVSFVLLFALASCFPVMRVGSGGLLISDLQFESNYRDQSGQSYICDNKISSLNFRFAYSDFSKIAGWEAQLIGLKTARTLPRLVQTRDGGGFRVIDNHIVVDWVLAEGIAPLSIVVTPVPQPNIIGRTSLELLVRATDGGSVSLRLPGIPVVDNCQ
jgi:hypothetical protein